MSQNLVQTNQIIKVQTDKKLIGFYDKLKKAPIERYAQIHAKGDVINGKRTNSLIGISLQDYSNGTGKNNRIVQFNLEPEQIQFLLTRVEAGWQEFEWSADKIFGEPNAGGYSTAQKIVINRHPLRKDGSPSTSPWFISISNGKGIRLQNKTGGFYMKGGSYVQESNVYINLTDMDMYKLLKRTDTFIKNWEKLVADQILLQGQESYAAVVANLKNQNNQPQYQPYQSNPQPQPQYQPYQPEPQTAFQPYAPVYNGEPYSQFSTNNPYQNY